MHYQRSFGALGLIGLLLVACSNAPAAPAPTNVPGVPTQAAQSTVAVMPTQAPPVQATAPTEAPAAVAPAPTEATTALEFTTPEGYHGLGKIDAPATIVMYSDVF